MVCHHEFHIPHELDSHLINHHNFSDAQREATVHQSLGRSYTKRESDDCLLCCRNVEKDDRSMKDKLATGTIPEDSGKREFNFPLPGESSKRRRVDAHEVTPSSNLSDETLQFQESTNPPTKPDPLHAEKMSRHIADHLQKLMLVLIRLMNLSKSEDEQASDDVAQIFSTTTVSGSFSSRDASDQNDSLIFVPSETEAGQMDLDSEPVPLNKSALDSLSPSPSHDTKAAVETWNDSVSVIYLDGRDTRDWSIVNDSLKSCFKKRTLMRTTKDIFLEANGDVKDIRRLSARKDYNSLGKESQVAMEFYEAANAGDVLRIEQLLEEGKKPDAKNENGLSPLWIAAYRGHERVVRILAHRRDVDVNNESITGRSPIFWPSRLGYEKIVRILMEAGAEPHLVDENGDTPVIVARKSGYQRITEILEGRSMKLESYSDGHEEEC